MPWGLSGLGGYSLQRPPTDPGDQVIGRGCCVEHGAATGELIGSKRFERGELILEHVAAAHEVILPGLESAEGGVEVGGEVDEPDSIQRQIASQSIPIPAGQGRAGHDQWRGTTAGEMLGHDRVQPVEPGLAIGVGQRDARRHLRHVLGRMMVIAVDEPTVQPSGEGSAHR
ncbi:MAG: hypothetical protein RLZZ440_965 [Planctomycetota bacterium]